MAELQSLPRMLNELLILSVLRGEPRHGYQIGLEIEEKSGGYFTFNHGTLYPILHHLEKEGLIDGSWAGSAGQRRRKEYSITKAGHARLHSRLGEWRELDARLGAFVSGGTPVRGRSAANQ